MCQGLFKDKAGIASKQQSLLPLSKIAVITVDILIMNSAGSPTSLCIMRCYALSDLILSVQGHFFPGWSHAL